MFKKVIRRMLSHNQYYKVETLLLVLMLLYVIRHFIETITSSYFPLNIRVQLTLHW